MSVIIIMVAYFIKRDLSDLLKWVGFWILMPFVYWLLFQWSEELKREKNKELLKKIYKNRFGEIKKDIVASRILFSSIKNIDKEMIALNFNTEENSTFYLFDFIDILKNRDKDFWNVFLQSWKRTSRIIIKFVYKYIDRFPEESERFTKPFFWKETFQWFLNWLDRIDRISIKNLFERPYDQQKTIVTTILYLYAYIDDIEQHLFNDK